MPSGTATRPVSLIFTEVSAISYLKVFLISQQRAGCRPARFMWGSMSLSALHRSCLALGLALISTPVLAGEFDVTVPMHDKGLATWYVHAQIADLGGRSLALRADVTDAEQMRDAVATIVGEFGRVALEVLEDGVALVLVENHCPICDAARSCGSLCSNELEVFRGCLGAGFSVERVEHILAGQRRCAYRVEPL